MEKWDFAPGLTQASTVSSRSSIRFLLLVQWTQTTLTLFSLFSTWHIYFCSRSSLFLWFPWLYSSLTMWFTWLPPSQEPFCAIAYMWLISTFHFGHLLPLWTQTTSLIPVFNYFQPINNSYIASLDIFQGSNSKGYWTVLLKKLHKHLKVNMLITHWLQTVLEFLFSVNDNNTPSLSPNLLH